MVALNQRGNDPLDIKNNEMQNRSMDSDPSASDENRRSHKVLVRSYRYFREVAEATFILFRDIGEGIKKGACALGRWFRPKLYSVVRKTGRFCMRVFRAVAEPLQKIRRGCYLIGRNYHFHREEHSVFPSIVYALKTFMVGLSTALRRPTFWPHHSRFFKNIRILTQLFYKSFVNLPQKEFLFRFPT